MCLRVVGCFCQQCHCRLNILGLMILNQKMNKIIPQCDRDGVVQTSEKESMKDEFVCRDLETKADGIPFE